MNQNRLHTPTPEAKNIYERATRAELAKDFDTAFRLYVEAGSAFLNLSRTAAYPHSQKQALQDANRALGRAERIQAAVKRDLAPVWRDPFALEEQQLVLKKGSVINGVEVPPWTTPSPGFEAAGTGSSFSDPDGLLELSDEQKEAAVVWRRSSEALASAKIFLRISARRTSRSASWPIALFAHPSSTEVEALLDDLSLDDHGDDQRRVIDIAWDDVCNLFGTVCVSWNPSMFKNQLLYHGVWRAANSLPAGRDESVHRTLRLLLERVEDAQIPLEEVWILLTRHRTDTRRSSEFISLHAEYDDGHPNARKDLSDIAKTQGIYTDNPHFLVRVTVPPSDGSGTISLNLSYDGLFDGIGFSITAYSGFSMRWDRPLRTLLFDLRIPGALTAKTSGGNYTLPTYMINPQYRLHVPATTQHPPSTKTRVEVSLHVPRDVPINAAVTWGRGKRVFDLAQNDIIATSGAYTYGFARLCADLPPGDFTLAVSAFSPTHFGEFSLFVCSSRRIEVDPIPQEGAGMFAKTMRGEWANSACPRYSLELPASADVKCVFPTTNTLSSALSHFTYGAPVDPDERRLCVT
ncbi:hypothetical protein BC826DRAFT_1104390 [Russula brevipes]|nr:hypothetical protein BC826DRAFT_1104390 [Russula brevipes]